MSVACTYRGSRRRTVEAVSAPGPKRWWTAILTYPPTWVAGALLAALTIVYVAAFDPSGVMTAAALGVVVVAIVAWPLAMATTGTLSARQFATGKVVDVEPAAIAALAAELAVLDDSQPAEQLAALEQKRATLVKVLDRRLDSGELTYSRYVSTSQQVYRSALDNLHEVAVANESLSSIDTAYIERRIAELDRGGGESDSVLRERATLARRSELRDAQVERIARLMAQNEAALTTLDRTTSALADVPIGQRPEDADEAMAALEALADRARMYADEGGS